MNFINIRNPSGSIASWNLTIQMSTRQRNKKMFLEIRARAMRMAENLSAICEPII
jgi:hypothetical protein